MIDSLPKIILFFTVKKCSIHYLSIFMLFFFRETNAVYKYMRLRHHKLLLLRQYTPKNGQLLLNDLKSRFSNNKETLADTIFMDRARLKHMNLSNKSLVIKLKGNADLQKFNDASKNLSLEKEGKFVKHRIHFHRNIRKFRKLQKKKYRLNRQNQTYKTNDFGYG